jgi:hypothetical protein
MTVQPIEQLLNAPTEKRDEMTQAWKEAKLDEHSFVGLAVRRDHCSRLNSNANKTSERSYLRSLRKCLLVVQYYPTT